MKLVSRNGKYVLYLAPNIAIHPIRVKPFNGKYLVYIFSGEPPVLAELTQ